MQQKTEPLFKYFTLLSMLYTTILLTSVLLDYKYVSIGSMLASSATFIISITFPINDVIAEIYGYRRARQVVWSGVACLVVFAVITSLLKRLPTPVEYAKYGSSYDVVLNLLFRACLCNAIAIACGAFFNVYFLSKWKALVKGKYFWLRSLGSSAIGESLYTFFVILLLNIGMVNFSQFVEIILISYSYKLLFNLISIIPTSLLVSFLKKSESIDIYDFPQRFTPFKYLGNAENKDSC